jgi:TetR/AcrR family transcriptional regulator, transcriptional repressor for nem operon
MRYGKDQKEITRDRVLKAAAKQMRERGPERIALASVMADANLTHGGFYAHFESKDDFLRAAVERMFADSPFGMLTDEGQTASEALIRFIDFYLSPDHRDMRDGGCPLPFLAADAPRLSPEIRQRLAKAAGTMMKVVARHLATLGHLDAEDEASSCVAEIIGAMVLARAEPSPEGSDVILDRSRSRILRRLKLE